MPKLPTLDDLTKQELIDIIKGHYVPPTPAEIAWIIYRRRCDAALEKMNRLANKPAFPAGQKWTVREQEAWLKNTDDWFKATEEHEKAEKWYRAVKKELERISDPG